MEKRTTDLFRFATLRSPELITPTKKKIGFIDHPLPDDSHFLSNINPSDDLNARRATVIASISSFNEIYTNVSDIKNLDLPFWEFSQWLLAEKNRLDLDLIAENLPSYTIGDTDILKLWDNFLYDVLVKKNPYVRQACIQIIVTYNFVKTYSNYIAVLNNDETDIPKLEKQAKDLKRLANAKILIQEEFATSKNLEFLANLSSTNNADLQEQVHENFISHLPITNLKQILTQLAYVESEHSLITNINFENELSSFKTATATAVENFLTSNPDITQKIVVKEKTTFEEKKGSINLNQDTESFQSDTLSSIENLIPESVTPDFNFTPEVPLSGSFLGSLRTRVPELTNFLAANNLIEKPIEEVRGIIDKEITKKKGLQSQFLRKSVKEILINGAVVKKKGFSSIDFALSYYSIDLNGEVQLLDPNSIYLSLNAGYKSAFIEEISYKMTINSTEYDSSEFKVIPNKGNQLFLKLFIQNEISVLEEDTIFTFEASFKLSNGNSYKIYKKGITSNTILSGIAIPLYNAGNEVELYGVNKIGVADYRRVEQELCCYIPGEVSHIENVMAREYKEKSTRNFTSTSVTVDTVTEREAETTSDTTSTSRNELSSAISDVIQKDKANNVGLNASVNGDFGTYGFNVGANASFSNSTSTSSSDSIARSYAEDVTKRALERIVQKVSQRRTSTILKEYEENNKHGFDNRKGVQHVTGVYRWIDKVYKNRIVNYHKRLMYEFMIPEPARFYKEAIIMKANEELASSTLNGSTGEQNTAIKPIHPSEYGLTKFDDVSRNDYATIASHYGISVDQPNEEFISIPGAVSASIGNGDKDESRTFSPITIDPNYECINIKGTLSYSVKARVKSWAYIKFNLPGQPLAFGDLRGEYSASTSVNRNYSPGIKTSVTFSAGTKKITGYNGNFTLRCRWADSAFKAWQQSVYDDIMAEYNRQLQVYNDAKTAAEQELAEQQAMVAEKETLPQNPKYNSQIVQIELKRLCIEMLTKPFGIQQGRDFYQSGGCDVPELILGPELDKYASSVVFFENAFDWDILTQIFYPYYWAKRCDWVSLFQGQSSDDYIFQAFLQSGMGRVILPVKPGFEDAVVYFMETGEVWNGLGIALNTDDELYVSIVDEMTQVTGTVEGEEWDTIVPTDLTILQAKSVFLDEEGLPCCHTDEEVLAELTLKKDENILTWEE